MVVDIIKSINYQGWDGPDDGGWNTEEDNAAGWKKKERHAKAAMVDNVSNDPKLFELLLLSLIHI